MSVCAGRWGFNFPRVTFSEPPTVGSVCGDGRFLVPRLVTVCVCISPGLNSKPVKPRIVSGSDFLTPLACWVVNVKNL